MAPGRATSIGPDINYEVILDIIRELYVPSKDFEKKNKESGIYIQYIHNTSYYFSFHPDKGVPNKIHLNFTDSNGVQKQIGLKLRTSSSGSGNVKILNKEIRDKLPPIFNDELDLIESFISRKVIDIMDEYPTKKQSYKNWIGEKKAKIYLLRCKDQNRELEEKNKELEEKNIKLKEEIRRLDDEIRRLEHKNERPDDPRLTKIPRYHQKKYTNLDDKDYKQLYIKYKSKYLQLKNKLFCKKYYSSNSYFQIFLQATIL